MWIAYYWCQETDCMQGMIAVRMDEPPVKHKCIAPLCQRCLHLMKLLGAERARERVPVKKRYVKRGKRVNAEQLSLL